MNIAMSSRTTGSRSKSGRKTAGKAWRNGTLVLALVTAAAAGAVPAHAGDDLAPASLAAMGPGLADGATPSAALASLAARHGVPLDDEAARAAAELDALPAPARNAVAALVDAFAGFEDATLRAFEATDLARVAAWQDGAVALAPGVSAEMLWREARFDPAPVIGARAALLDAALHLRGALAATPWEARPEAPVHVPGVAFLGITARCTDDVYAEDVPLLVDECGDDVYRNNAGGSNLVGGCIDISFGPGAAALVDLAGQDAYVSGRGCGINGGAAVGAGFLFDAAGDDVYLAPSVVNGANKGVNGGGAWLGLGFLRDEAGNDRYASGGWGTNGGGYIGGNGVLHDLAGDDAYEASFDGVNGGGSAGVGMLLDEGGTDAYREGCHATCSEAWDETIVPKGSGAQMDH